MMKVFKKQLLFLLLCIPHLGITEFYSQHGQDQFVYETYFKNHFQGTFVDIGAHNGILFSNTWFFEKELGWSGICIEPIPEIFAQLKNMRNCLCINGCIATEHNMVKTFMRISGWPIEMLSGLVDTFDPNHKQRIERELVEYNGSYEMIEVPCFNLNRILEDAWINHIHFLSLDTEGGEFEILQNFDFSKCQIDVIAVEDNYKIHDFVSFLNTKGFQYVTSIQQDLIFVNRKLNR